MAKKFQLGRSELVWELESKQGGAQLAREHQRLMAVRMAMSEELTLAQAVVCLQPAVHTDWSLAFLNPISQCELEHFKKCRSRFLDALAFPPVGIRFFHAATVLLKMLWLDLRMRARRHLASGPRRLRLPLRAGSLRLPPRPRGGRWNARSAARFSVRFRREACGGAPAPPLQIHRRPGYPYRSASMGAMRLAVHAG